MNDLVLIPSASEYYESLSIRKSSQSSGIPLNKLIREEVDISKFEDLSNDYELV